MILSGNNYRSREKLEHLQKEAWKQSRLQRDSNPKRKAIKPTEICSTDQYEIDEINKFAQTFIRDPNHDTELSITSVKSFSAEALTGVTVQRMLVFLKKMENRGNPEKNLSEPAE